MVGGAMGCMVSHPHYLSCHYTYCVASFEARPLYPATRAVSAGELL